MDLTVEIKRKLEIVKALSRGNESSKLALLSYDYRMEYKTEFGQRIFFSYDIKRSEIPKGSEIFVGHLPRNIFEDTLIPLFSKVGKICEMRLMLEFSGLNRGFCFVVFKNPEIANIAISMFHGYKILDENICVYKSLNNCRLDLSNVPLNMSLSQVECEMRKLYRGVVGVVVKEKNLPENQHKGNVFVDFETHRHAMEARKGMWPSKISFNGQQIFTEWAKPERSPLARYQTTLLIKNVPPTVTKEAFVKFVGKRIQRDSTVLNVFCKNGSDKALLEFATIGYAEMALNELNRILWKGHILQVSWFRKVDIPLMENDFDLSGWCYPAEDEAGGASTSSRIKQRDIDNLRNYIMTRHNLEQSQKYMKILAMQNRLRVANESVKIESRIKNFKRSIVGLDEIWKKYSSQFIKINEVPPADSNNFENSQVEKSKPRYQNPINNEPFSYFANNDGPRHTPTPPPHTLKYSTIFNKFISNNIFINFHKTLNVHPNDPTLKVYQQYMRVFDKDYIIEKIIGQWILYKKLMETIKRTNNVIFYQEAIVIETAIYLYPLHISELFLTPKINIPQLQDANKSASQSTTGNAYVLPGRNHSFQSLRSEPNELQFNE